MTKGEDKKLSEPEWVGTCNPLDEEEEQFDPSEDDGGYCGGEE